MKTIKIILFLLIGLTANAKEDASTSVSRNFLSLELDPAPFILGGYSFSLKYSPAKLSHFTIMGSMYRSAFPDKMMKKSNFEKGFRDLKINTSYAVFADYFISNDRTGIHFGPAIFYYSKSVGFNSNTETTSFKSIYPNLRAGYVYKPFRNSGFYLNPWINVGKETIASGRTKLGGEEFSNDKLSYIVAIHFGYQLTF
jgi:hypothetical protein